MTRQTECPRIPRPVLLPHGGGGANTPGDRETRYAPYDSGRENRNTHVIP